MSPGSEHTTTDRPAVQQDDDPFLVVGSLSGQQLLISAGSAPAAVAAAGYWRRLGATAVRWFLRDDLPHERSMLLFTLHGDGFVHATELVAGKSASAHPATCCGLSLDWDTGSVQVCYQEAAPPCQDCIAVVTGHDGAMLRRGTRA